MNFRAIVSLVSVQTSTRRQAMTYAATGAAALWLGRSARAQTAPPPSKSPSPATPTGVVAAPAKPASASRQMRAPTPMARIGAVEGAVQVTRLGVPLQIRAGMSLREGDDLRTPAGGEALLQFSDGGRLALRENSHIQLESLQLSGAVQLRNLSIRMAKGALRYISGKATVRKNVRFVTATATIGIRGTDIEIVLNEEATEQLSVGTVLKVNTGAASLAAPDGTQVNVAAGEQALGAEADLIPRGSNRIKRAQARALDAVIKATTGELFKGGALDRMMR